MADTSNRRRSSNSRKLSRSGISLYELLGLQKTATDDEIKKSYRKLALQLHPDKNPNNPDAEARFKEINRAHSVLMDEQKREIYDKYGSWGLNMASQMGYERAKMILRLNNPFVKGLMLFLFVITGCCYCCCCCYCCFNFCCGKCAPKSEEDEDVEFNDIHVVENGEVNDTDGPHIGDQVIIMLPATEPGPGVVSEERPDQQ